MKSHFYTLLHTFLAEVFSVHNKRGKIQSALFSSVASSETGHHSFSDFNCIERPIITYCFIALVH